MAAMTTTDADEQIARTLKLPCWVPALLWPSCF
jgi:hypothetical protein